MSMRCTGEKCPLKGLLDELQGGIESCTAHNCPNRTLPVADAPEEDKQYSGLIEDE